MPEEIFRKFNTIIKKNWKVAFFSAIIIGFLTHMYVFTNMLPNHDGVNNIYDAQRKFYSGRFFLSPVSGISSYFDLPWINGTLGILYLALASVVLVEIFKLKKTPAIILLSGLMVTFPTIASTFSYMFTADGYMGGILIAVLAVWVTQKFKYGFIPAIFIFLISVGIYQANLPIVLNVVAVWFALELAFTDRNLKSILIDLFKQIVMVTIGMVIYIVMFKTYQRKNFVTDYQGINDASLVPYNIFEAINKIKDSVKNFFFEGFLTDSPITLFDTLNLILIFLIVFGILLAIIKIKIYKSPIRTLFIVLSLMALPLFTYLLYLTSSGVKYHMLMVMSLVFVYAIPIILYDRLEFPSFSVRIFSWVAVIVIGLTVYNFSVISNISYFNMTLKYEKSTTLLNRVIDRIEQTDGYENVTKITVIGQPKFYSKLSAEIIPDRIPGMIGATGETYLQSSKHFSSALSNYFGITLEHPSSKELEELKQTGILQEMDTWPSKNSVRIYKDIAIVKFN